MTLWALRKSSRLTEDRVLSAADAGALESSSVKPKSPKLPRALWRLFDGQVGCTSRVMQTRRPRTTGSDTETTRGCHCYATFIAHRLVSSVLLTCTVSRIKSRGFCSCTHVHALVQSGRLVVEVRQKGLELLTGSKHGLGQVDLVL